MDIIVGKTAGFCYGVKRAVDGAKDKTKNEKGKIFCIGEIVHNKQVIDELQNEGIIFVKDIKEVKNKAIIRAHGIKKEVYKEAERKGVELIDYTCPNVIRIHEIAQEYSKKGYYIFICGNKNHPESVGTISYCGKNFYVIEKENDTYKALEELNKSGVTNLLVISQTTYSLEKFYNIEEIIKNEISKNINLLIKNTICRATELRQKETEKISKGVDYMIIIGGANSSNTQKLYEIAKKNCKECTCVEYSEQIDLENLKGKRTIGIMAGASTPSKSIDEVYNKIKNIGR